MGLLLADLCSAVFFNSLHIRKSVRADSCVELVIILSPPLPHNLLLSACICHMCMHGRVLHTSDFISTPCLQLYVFLELMLHIDNQSSSTALYIAVSKRFFSDHCSDADGL